MQYLPVLRGRKLRIKCRSLYYILQPDDHPLPPSPSPSLSLSLWKNNLMMFWVLVSANPYSDSSSPLWTLDHCQVFSSLLHLPRLARPPDSFYTNFTSILSPPHPDCLQSPRSYWYDIVILTKESRDYPQNCTQKVYLTFRWWRQHAVFPYSGSFGSVFMIVFSFRYQADILLLSFLLLCS